VTARALKNDRVRPIVAELVAGPGSADSVRAIGAPARQTLGWLTAVGGPLPPRSRRDA
jgi:hypothetical protein